MNWKNARVLAGACVVALLAAAYLGLRAGPAEDPAHEPPQELAQEPAVSAEHSAEKSSLEPARSEGVTVPEQAPTSSPALADTRSRTDSARFRSLRRCFHASLDFAAAKETGNCKIYEGRQEFEHAYAECLNGWMDWRNRLAAAEKTLAECGDVTNIARQYYDATREAAKAGDADAQLCYLQSAFNWGSQLPITEADVAEYVQISPTYVDAAFKRGDWRIASLLTRRGFHPGSGPVTRLEKIGQPETIYRMVKLMRFGASGRYAFGLDNQLELLEHPDLNPAAALPPDTIKQANAWAQETYNAYYSGVPGLTEPPVVCDRS